ncbi:MAG: ATP-dependent DNA helicase RecG [Candidatus Omnitrophica bacterium]|nr:ATP-dependent DNA helicase RecG [Candidatus Omnitrophota bacterium]
MKDLSVSARFIKGVGPSRLKLLNRLGIETVEDLLYYIPSRYEDRSKIKPVAEVKPGSFETIKAKVLTFGDRTTKKGMNIFKVAMGDATGVIHAVWFNQPYMKDKFKIGQELILYGKVENINKLRYSVRGLQINNPEYEILTGTKDDSVHMGRIVPIYRLTENLNQHWLRNILNFTVTHYIDGIKDLLPYDIRRRNSLMVLKEAVRNIHFPISEIVFEKAKHRLIFDEFLLLQVGIALKRAKIKIDLKGLTHNIDGRLIDRFKKILPFEFTDAQSKVIKEIEQDMKNSKPMNRLLQGDVGSGKTVVALYALILTVQNGYQGALMVPTEILAEQHYRNIKDLLKGLSIRVVLLAGDINAQERARRRHMIETGDADIIVGTHALIQQGVNFKRLGLAVIDEQHKFGVMQRAILRSKSMNPDVLIMTATPIPRTLALTLYGDLDISIIDELPPGRGEIKTLYFEEVNREKAYLLAGEQARLGRQVYVVYPLIEDSEKSDLRAAKNMYKELTSFFSDTPHLSSPHRGEGKGEGVGSLKVALLHGKMKSKEKEKIMGDFKANKIDILVSTIIIEVGVDVRNASCMIIEHAERFGLSQLHQLRGRIGRSHHISYCVLISDPKSEEAKRRLHAMLKTQDGFKIAEEDLEIRGPGEFFGTKQHGLPELKIGNIVRDRELLEIAKSEALELIKKDRFLRRPENRFIREGLMKKFKREELELASIG